MARVSRGLRNNNPGNIEDGSWAKAQPGYRDRKDSRFAGFATPEDGIAAMGALLSSYQTARGLMTPASMIGRWAPPVENPTAKYAAAVAKNMGIAPTTPFSMQESPALASRMMEAMTAFENRIEPYGIGAYETAAARLAGITPESYATAKTPASGWVSLMSAPGIVSPPAEVTTTREFGAPISAELGQPSAASLYGPAPMSFSPVSEPTQVSTFSVGPVQESPAAPSVGVPSFGLSPQSLAVNPMGPTVGGIPTTATAFGTPAAVGPHVDPLGAPAVSGFTPGQFGAYSTVSAAPSQPAQSVAPQATEQERMAAMESLAAGLAAPPSVKSVTTVSTPGLTAPELGMAPQDISSRIAEAHNVAPAPSGLYGNPQEAIAAAQQSVFGAAPAAATPGAAPISTPSPAATTVSAVPSAPSMTSPNLSTAAGPMSAPSLTSAAFGAPVGAMPSMSTFGMMPGAVAAPVSAALSPAQATVSAPQQAPADQVAQAAPGLGVPGIATAPSMTTAPMAPAAPAPAMTPPAPAMAAPQATVAPPAQTQQQQQQKASSQPAAPSVAAPQSLTANLDSALGVAAAMSQQAKNAMAGMNPNANTKADTTPGGQKGGNTGKSSGGGSSSGAGASKGGGSSTDSGKSSGKGGVGSVGNKGDGRGFGGKSKGDDGSAW